jgi:hypothetical protein
MNFKHPLVKPVAISAGVTFLVVEAVFEVGIFKGWSFSFIEALSAVPRFVIALLLLRSVYQGPHAPRRGAWQRMSINDYYVMQLQAQQRNAGVKQRLRMDLAAASVAPLFVGVFMVILSFL